MYAFSGRAVFNSVASVTRFSLLSGAAAPSVSFLDFEAIFPVKGRGMRREGGQDAELRACRENVAKEKAEGGRGQGDGAQAGAG